MIHSKSETAQHWPSPSRRPGGRAALSPRNSPLSFRDAPLGAGPESILPVVVLDSGLARSLSSGRALRGPVGTPRNDENFWIGKHMTIATIDTTKPKIDWTKPVMALF